MSGTALVVALGAGLAFGVYASKAVIRVRHTVAHLREVVVAAESAFKATGVVVALLGVAIVGVTIWTR